MGRYDKDNLDHLSLPDPEPTEANYYTESGERVSRSSYLLIVSPPMVCAKEVQHKQTKITTYFILCTSNGQMFDPRVIDKRYRKKTLWSFRRVTRTAFDLYLKFLIHKYTSLLQQAQRVI